MSDYEQRKQKRIARYEARAEKAWGESENLSRQADDMASANINTGKEARS